MMDWSTLLVYTATEKHRFTKNYDIHTLNSSKSEDSYGEFLRYSAIITGGSEPRHSIIILYASELDKTADCKVQCSCPYFRYRNAPALYKMGATDLEVKDIPERLAGVQKPGLCAHLFLLSDLLLSGDVAERQRIEAQSRPQSVNQKLRN